MKDINSFQESSAIVRVNPSEQHNQSVVAKNSDVSITESLPRDIQEVSIEAAPPVTVLRDNYNAIILSALPRELSGQIHDLVRAAGNAEKIDEHGSWSFGAEFGKRGEVSALNWDLYGYGYDVHGGGLLAVIQIRQFYRKRRDRFAQIRKNYYLLGRNEDGKAFAHSVSANVVRRAVRCQVDVVLAVQNWIFGGEYKTMVRQGDLAIMLLARRPSAPKVPERTMVLQQSHRLKANIIRRDGTAIYAKNPQLVHLPGTHPEVRGENRWYKIIVGTRAEYWRFAAPTVD